MNGGTNKGQAHGIRLNGLVTIYPQSLSHTNSLYS